MSGLSDSSASRTVPETTIIHQLNQTIAILAQEFNSASQGVGAGTSAIAAGVEESKSDPSSAPSADYQAFITTASGILGTMTTAYEAMAQQKYRDEDNPKEKKGKGYAEGILNDAKKTIEQMWDWINKKMDARGKNELIGQLNQLTELTSNMGINSLPTNEALKLHWALSQLLKFTTIKIHVDPISLVLKAGFNEYLSFPKAISYITQLESAGFLVKGAVNLVVPDLLKSPIPSALVRSSESLQGLFQALHAHLEKEGRENPHILMYVTEINDKATKYTLARSKLDLAFNYSLDTEFPLSLQVALAKSPAERDALWRAAAGKSPVSSEPSDTRVALDPRVSLSSSHRDSEDQLTPSLSSPSPLDLVSSQSANLPSSPDYSRYSDSESDANSDLDSDSDPSLPESKPQAISATPAENPERTPERAPSGESLDHKLDADIGSSERHSAHLTSHPDPALREFYRELQKITIGMMVQEMSKKFETDSKTLEKYTLLKNLMSKEPATVEELTKKLYQAERILSHKSFGFRFQGYYSEDFNRLHKGNFLTLRSKIKQSHPNLVLIDQESVLRPKPKNIPRSVNTDSGSPTPLFKSYKEFKKEIHHGKNLQKSDRHIDH
jgi:hypothetical protein